MSNPTTPGVSVEEIAKLPHSIALVETAIPSFIGYTEKRPLKNNGEPEPYIRITSLLEYEKYFGKAKKESIKLEDTEDNGARLVTPEVQFLMYYSLQMYFANGGGPCYIVPVGIYDTSSEVKYEDLQEGLAVVNSLVEPTLIVFPDAISLADQEEFYAIYNQAMNQAKLAKNRFVILDTYYGNSTTTTGGLNTIEYFRSEIDLSNYGAAYFPHLKTILNYTFDEDATIMHTGLQQVGQNSADFYADEIAALEELKILASDEISSGSANAFVLGDLLDQAIAIAEEVNETADFKDDLTEAIDEAKAVLYAINDGTIDNFIIPDDLDENAPVFSGEFEALKAAILYVKDEKGDAEGITLNNLKATNSALYNQIKNEIASSQVVLPPSSTIAGIYAKVDSTKGVWKAPANISLNYVITPTEKVSNQEQSDLNITASGKSINAIRTFTGKGTLVWGARTLDGKDKKVDNSDNQWKYIQVRRYCDMVERSIQIAIERFRYEPNAINTWLRAKATIENFLNQQWMDGALAGSTTEEAYEVKVGSNETETMNVTVKIAVVRPAEFIVLNFSHKLQQS